MRKTFIVIAICLCALVPAISLAQEVFGWQGDVAFFAAENGKIGLMNRAGDILAEPVYDGGGLFGPGVNGLACVTLGDRVGAIDRNGELVIPLTEGQELQPEWDGFSLEPYAGLYQMFHADGSMSYYTETGKRLGDRKWLFSYGFAGNSAVVESEEGWNLLSVDGELLLDEWYDTAYDTGNGGVFCKGDLRITADGNGRIHSYSVYENDEVCMKRWWDPATGEYHDLPREWQNARLCSADLMVYQQNGLWGLARRNGTVLSAPEWDSIGTYGIDSVPAPMVAEKNGLYGLLSPEGNILLQPQWEWMDVLGDDVCIARYEDENGNDRYCTLDLAGNIIDRLPAGVWVDLLERFGYNTYNCYRAYEPHEPSGWCVLAPNGKVVFVAEGEKANGSGPVELDDGTAIIRFVKDGRPAYLTADQTVVSDPEWAMLDSFVDDAYFNVISNQGIHYYIGLYEQPDIVFPAAGGLPGSSIRIDGAYYVHLALIDWDGTILGCWANDEGKQLYPYR